MSLEAIKKILDQRYDGYSWDTSCITKHELDEFVKEFVEIEALRKEYHEGNCNRKELGEEISRRSGNLRYLANAFATNLSCAERINDSPEVIEDYEKAMELLLTLANNGDKEYIMKSFCTQAIGSLETKHGDRETGMFQGEIRVIGEKSVLDTMDNSKPYLDPNFRTLIESKIDDGNSFAIITKHMYEENVFPFTLGMEAKKQVFWVYGMESNLMTYTYDDELGHAVNMLEKYIEYYGGNFENLSLETLKERTNELKEKANVLKKNNR